MKKTPTTTLALLRPVMRRADEVAAALVNTAGKTKPQQM